MSAYMVSKAQIDALVTYAVENRLTTLAPDDAGKLLWGGNLKSIQALYPGSWAEMTETGDESFVSSYRYEPARVSVPQLYYAAVNYDYQASEHAAWEGSEAQTLTMRIKAHTVAEGADLNRLKWGLDEEDVTRDPPAAPDAYEPRPGSYYLQAGRVIIGPTGVKLATLQRGDVLPTEADRFARQIVAALNADPNRPDKSHG